MHPYIPFFWKASTMFECNVETIDFWDVIIDLRWLVKATWAASFNALVLLCGSWAIVLGQSCLNLFLLKQKPILFKFVFVKTKTYLFLAWRYVSPVWLSQVSQTFFSTPPPPKAEAGDYRNAARPSVRLSVRPSVRPSVRLSPTYSNSFVRAISQ